MANMAVLLRSNLSGLISNHTEIALYSPPGRAFFTPPLPPEYQNPFADKPTLRGTNNEGLPATSAGGSGFYVNRRPIPPPSLTPGHERIPLRPPDTTNNFNGSNNPLKAESSFKNIESIKSLSVGMESKTNPFEGTNENKETGNKKTTLDPQGEILPSIRRILSGSNGKNGDIPDVLLKHVTAPPMLIFHQPTSSPPIVILNNTAVNGSAGKIIGNANITSNINHKKVESFKEKLRHNEDTNVVFPLQMDHRGKSPSEVRIITPPSPSPATSGGLKSLFDHDLVQVLRPANNSILGRSAEKANNSSLPGLPSSTIFLNNSTWNIAWNLHIYLSVILFTILAVYSLYKLLTYNKLTHLFPQSYFLCIHTILIVISTSRIFYLCYDAYNINSSFHVFVSELLLNLPATLLTVSFSVLMLFLFRKSLNHKHNRYSALMRPLTVVVGCSVHVVLCITLHYVESYTMDNYYQQHQIQNQHQQQQQLLYHQHFYRSNQQQLERHYDAQNTLSDIMNARQNTHFSIGTYQQNTVSTISTSAGYVAPPRVLSLICQIIYIFVCLSMGLLYLHLYRLLKRILRSKSQNYIHGFQNLSYAIHITIATALLFVLMAALQIFGAIGISAKRQQKNQNSPAAVEIDWLKWGYQFSLRLIEITIIILISWVTGLKTKVNSSMPSGSASGNVQHGNGVQNIGMSSRQKLSAKRHHGGFFLPCTSTSSQENFETDYPVVCSANTNLHTYTMRTGKLIYDDRFTLRSLAEASTTSTAKHNTGNHKNSSEYQKPYETNSLRSVNGVLQPLPQSQYHQYSTTDYLTDTTADHYENPNFELQNSNRNIKYHKTCSGNSTTTGSSNSGGGFSCTASGASSQQQILYLQNEGSYSEPNYEYNNFEGPRFGRNTNTQTATMLSLETTEYRDSNSCASSNSNSANFTTIAGRRSGKCNTGRIFFDPENKKSCNFVRKSGTLSYTGNNIYKSTPIPKHQAKLCPPSEALATQTPLEKSNSRTQLQIHHNFEGLQLEHEHVSDTHHRPAEAKSME